MHTITNDKAHELLADLAELEFQAADEVAKDTRFEERMNLMTAIEAAYSGDVLLPGNLEAVAATLGYIKN